MFEKLKSIKKNESFGRDFFFYENFGKSRNWKLGSSTHSQQQK